MLPMHANWLKIRFLHHNSSDDICRTSFIIRYFRSSVLSDLGPTLLYWDNLKKVEWSKIRRPCRFDGRFFQSICLKERLFALINY